MTPLPILAYKPGPAPQTIAMETLVCCEPLELEWLDTYLDGEDVLLLDGMVDDRDPVAAAAVHGARVVLMTSFITQVNHCLALAKRFKTLDPQPFVFVGGPHAEVIPEHFFSPHIDGVYFADQLQAIATTVAKIKAKKDFRDVGGAAFVVDGVMRRNPVVAMGLSQLKAPKRRLFEQHPERYFYLHFERCASVKTAFGCHEQCSFCFCTEMNGGRFGPRPMDLVLDEIASLDSENVFIVDDNFLSSERRLGEFLEGLRARDLHKNYIVYGEAAFIATHEALLGELRRWGLAVVITGFEAIDDDSLQNMNKRARLDDNQQTIAICRRLDIELIALFIADPDWPVDQFRAMAAYVKKQGLDYAMFSTLTLFPGTQDALDHDFSQERDWWRYDLLRLHQQPKHMSAWRYYLWLSYLYVLPSLNGGAWRWMQRRVGFAGALRLSWRALISGLAMLYKIWRWR